MGRIGLPSTSANTQPVGSIAFSALPGRLVPCWCLCGGCRDPLLPDETLSERLDRDCSPLHPDRLGRCDGAGSCPLRQAVPRPIARQRLDGGRPRRQVGTWVASVTRLPAVPETRLRNQGAGQGATPMSGRLGCGKLISMTHERTGETRFEGLEIGNTPEGATWLQEAK